MSYYPLFSGTKAELTLSLIAAKHHCDMKNNEPRISLKKFAPALSGADN